MDIRDVRSNTWNLLDICEYYKKNRLKIARVTGIANVPALYNFIQIIETFLLVSFGYIFFRANSFADAVSIIKKIPTFSGPFFYEKPSTILLCLFGIIFIIAVEIKRSNYRGTITLFRNKSWIIRNLSYAMLIILILLIGVFDGGQFIYFQF